MSYSYQLQNGTWGSFDAQDFETATLTRQASGREELRIVIAGRAAVDALDFTDGEMVGFYLLGTSFFFGRAKRIRNRADATGDRREYVFRGPWEEFERRQLFGLWKNKAETFDAVPKTFTIVDDVKPTVGGWLEKLTEFVENRCDREYGTIPWERRERTVDANFIAPIRVPVEALGTMTFADAAVRALRWIPDMCFWFRHWGMTAGRSELVCNRAYYRQAFVARVGHDYEGGTAAQPEGLWTVCEVAETEGFAPVGVIVVWSVPVEPTEQELAEDANASVRLTYSYESYPLNAGMEIGDKDVIVFGAELEDDEDAPPSPALAQVVYEALSLFRTRGEVEWVGEFPLLALNPGQRLRITGTDCPAEWATLDGFVDTVTHDLKGGKTSVLFGPPSALGFGDFLELLRFWRGRSVVPESAASAQTDGDAQTYSFVDNGATESFSKTIVYLNVNGSYAPYYVMAKKAPVV